MNYNKLKSAVKKHSEQFKTDPDAVKEAVNLDYEPDEAIEIIKALENPEPEKQTGKQSAYKWFDEFEARIQKREVRNQYTNQIQTIITGWSLEKKKHPKFIEPHLAVQLNAFADGYDTLGIGAMLVSKDTLNPGSVITYESWATEQGLDLSKDINILLSKN